MGTYRKKLAGYTWEDRIFIGAMFGFLVIATVFAILRDHPKDPGLVESRPSVIRQADVKMHVAPALPVREP